MTIVVPALRAAVAPAPWVKNELWRNAREVPSLDLRFAEDKSLVDATTGSNLVDFTRASSGTYVGSDGLIKTAVTNLLTYSEDFSNAEWDTLTTATKVSATGIDDPSGGTTASTWRNDGTTVADGGIRRTVSGTSGLTYTYSAWIRRRTGTGDIFMVVGQNVDFDVTSQVTSEWNRISVTNTADANTRGYIFIKTPGDEIDIWGAQLEANSYATSYIPTSGSTATRAADVSTSAATFGNSWYEPDEGTVFVDADGFGSSVPSGDFQTLAGFNDGTNDTRIELGYMTSSAAYWNLRVSGSTSVSLLPLTSDVRRKIAGSFDSSVAQATANGGTALTDSSVVIPTVNKLDIGGLNNTDIKEFNGTIRRLTYWPTRLSNDTLQTITT